MHASPQPPATLGHIRTTMLELVLALGAVLDDDREVVRIARQLVRSGQVELTGNFRSHRLD
jgi:hypothetical protein